MSKVLWAGMAAACAIVAVILLIPNHHISAQEGPSWAATYNPYPPGILPSNLDSEIARVEREVDVIEGRAVDRWHALQPP